MKWTPLDAKLQEAETVVGVVETDGRSQVWRHRSRILDTPESG
jgi:hypothetical protein